MTFEPVTDWPPTTELGQPLLGHGDAPHFCGKSNCGTNIPGKVDPFCGHRGPHKHFGSELSVACMRIKGHDGNHSALVFSISEPKEWA